MLISWKDYELAVLEKVRLDAAASAVRVTGTEHGIEHHVLGQRSGTPRQLDVAIYRLDESRPFFIGDAKQHAKKIDVTVVDSFVGLMGDVGATMGLLVAPHGFTPGALEYAENAAVKVWIMTIEEALTYKWLPEARRIFPFDWTFHEQLAQAVRHLNDGLFADEIVDALESVHYEEWSEFVTYALANHAGQAVAFLQTIAEHHHDDGWRFNAIQRLDESGHLASSFAQNLLGHEQDADVAERLRDFLTVTRGAEQSL